MKIAIMISILEKGRAMSESMFRRWLVKQIVPMLVTWHLLAKSKTKIESSREPVTSRRNYRQYPPELSDGRVCTLLHPVREVDNARVYPTQKGVGRRSSCVDEWPHNRVGLTHSGILNCHESSFRVEDRGSRQRAGNDYKLGVNDLRNLLSLDLLGRSRRGDQHGHCEQRNQHTLHCLYLLKKVLFPEALAVGVSGNSDSTESRAYMTLSVKDNKD